MIVDLTNLEKSALDLNYSFAPETIGLDADDAKLKSSVELKGKLRKSIVETTIEGEITAVIEIECTRCLQSVESKLQIPFKSGFVAAEHFTAAKEAELQRDDLDITIFEGDKINLSEVVREQILLALPEQVFCREDCRGLCEKCGANKNLIDCKCIEKESDPRWAALKNMK